MDETPSPDLDEQQNYNMDNQTPVATPFGGVQEEMI